MGAMYMSANLLTEPLITASYRNYWCLVEEKSAIDGQWFTKQSETEKSRYDMKAKQLARASVYTPDAAETGEMVTKRSFAKIDTATLQLLGWSSRAVDKGSTPESGVGSNDVLDSKSEHLYRISKDEFRKLRDQVNDIGQNLRNRFRTSAYQKLYSPTNVENNTNQLYRSRLAASLKAFKARDWSPIQQDEENSFFRCKPLNFQADDRDSQSRFSRVHRHFQPRSVPANICRATDSPETIPLVRTGNYDTLSPGILAQLIDNPDTSSHADNFFVMDKLRKSERKKTMNEENDSTSGIDSTQTEESNNSESDLEYETQITPKRRIPDLHLRPEKLDHIYIPENKKSWKRFDFDADHIDIPPYEFKSPLPNALCEIDLSQVVRLKQNWRELVGSVPREELASELLDRFVELEKLQQETEEFEIKRALQVSLKKPPIPQKKTLFAKPKDKRCCANCLQPACVGDCPGKSPQSPLCDSCKQSYCSGSCRENKYEQRMRQSRIDIDELSPTKGTNSRPCTSCQRKTNSKLINANNIVLGRPKSCNSTYTRGQNSMKPKDMRPRVETPINTTLLRSFEKLGIDPYQQAKQANNKMQRHRSKNSVFSGKYFYSQRKDSTSEQEGSGTKRRKLKSPKVKRPKTAG